MTLGRSADFTVRGDVFTKRGYGIGADLRTRANSRSFFNSGFYIVKDRVLGPKKDARHPDQGGSSFYEYSVPQAIISLKQGLGRLIRSTTDRGVLAVLGALTEPLATPVTVCAIDCGEAAL